MLETLVILLRATAIAVHISRRAGFGSILGYLVAGVAIGPAGLGLISDVEQIAHVSELGVVMLLFLIGLELRPHRLWVCASRCSASALAAGADCRHHRRARPYGGTGLGRGGGAWGCRFALSSTAIVLPMLGERQLLASTAGRDSFAVLLFQDIAFIPLVALVPVLAGGAMPDGLPWLEVCAVWVSSPPSCSAAG